MTEPLLNPNQTVVNAEEENWRLQFKKVFLAGLGAVSIAEEEMAKLVHRLVEKGALAEQDGRKWLKEFMEKYYHQTKDKVHTIEGRLENWDGILAKLNIPTKTQVEELSKKMEQLSAKVEELSKKLPS
jgi:poly(hydroxyalkanoate) granule-associated protein